MYAKILVLTSESNTSLVKTFSGPDLKEQPFSIGKEFNVTEEPASDLQSLSQLLKKLKNDPTQTIIRGSLTEGKTNPVPRNKETGAVRLTSPSMSIHLSSTSIRSIRNATR